MRVASLLLVCAKVQGRMQNAFKNTPMQRDVIKLPTDGKVPKDLEGTLYRNVPSLYDFGFKTVTHWFDSLSSVVAVGFKDSEVTYQRKMLETDLYKSVVKGTWPTVIVMT